MEKLRKKYRMVFPNIVDFVSVSSKSGKGIDCLKSKLIENAYQQRVITQEVPMSYIMLEGSIRSISKQKETMTLTEFRQFITEESGIVGDSVDHAINFMNDIGVIIHFEFGDNSHDDLIILNSLFLVDLMSSIITLKHNYARSGILNKVCLPQIWQMYPEDQWPYLLKLLDNFEISYNLPSEQTIIIPSLLPLEVDQNEINEHWEKRPYSQCYSRIYSFKFLPLGFFGRLIVRIFHMADIISLYYWKNGIILEDNTTREWAYIQYYELDYQLQIFIRREYVNNSCSLLRKIIGNVENLISWYNGKSPIVSMLCTHCLNEEHISNEESTMFSIEECLIALTGRKKLHCKYKGKNKRVAAPEVSLEVQEIAPDIALSDMSGHLIQFTDLSLVTKVTEGSFGELYKGVFNGEEVAVKILLNQNMQQIDLFTEAFKELTHEAFVMCSLSHNNIVNLLGLCTQPFCMVMEYYPLGSLDRYVHNPDPNQLFTEEYRTKAALDIAKGMKYLHDQVYMHRDLRSPNVLVASLDSNADTVARVTDFGTTVIASPFIFNGNLNDCWTAPEVFVGKEYDQASDVYAFGIVMWELFQKGIPFSEYEELSDKPRSDFTEAVIDGLRPSIPNNSNLDYVKIIEDCWSKDPLMRPRFIDIIVSLQDIVNY
eukprot:TRINITY_DN8592_c0_g1_i1.p1 TRINITY_DN8592_c0_g1~~TRINITY_DN8592_c0_g1_i1.p1  ORF type:complete len:655 (-),score=102.90 TRINITY_DN8592_c0_g1_i1:1655-3619(-)